MQKQYIEVPLPMSCSCAYRLWTRLKGILLSPLYLAMARIGGAPGTGFRLRCVVTGARLLFTGRASWSNCHKYLFSAMDSTRYFEFHEVWENLKGLPFTRYLDVSSPRLIPLFLVKATPGATVELINPDSADLRGTEVLANALGLKASCRFFNCTIEDARFPPASFDLITCISVLEHIPRDKTAIEAMWALLRPGGKLVLTLPCMARPLEQYISHNPYGVLNQEDDGYTFWQRYYDREKLQSSIYSITGRPAYMAVYGEKKRGFFFRNASMKRLLGSFYPFWREPYMMAAEYRSFSSMDDLPGEGVVMLKFVKPGEHK